MHTYFTHDMENENPKMKQNAVKWGYDCFQCLLMTGNPYTLRQKSKLHSHFRSFVNH